MVVAAPIAIVAFAFAVRIAFLRAQSLWLDEAVSWQASGWPAAQIVQFSRTVDSQPPGFYLLLHFLRAALGESEYALRLPSAFLGTLAVALTFSLARRWFGRPAGVLAAVLLAIAPVHVWYSQEARAYAALAALGVASALFFTVYWRRGPAWVLPALSLTNVAGLYLHYGMLAVIGGELLALAVLTRRRSLHRAGGLALAILAAGLLYAPWWPVLANRLERFSSGQVGTLARLDRFVESAGLPSDLLDPARDAAIGVGVVALLAGVAVLGRRGALLRAAVAARPAVVAAVSALAVAAVTLPGAFHEGQAAKRQLLVFLPFVLVGAGAGLARQARWTGASVAVTALLTISALGALLLVQRRDDWRATSAFLAEVWRPGDLVVVEPPYAGIPLSYYWARPPDAFEEVAGRPMPARAEPVWLILNHDELDARRRMVRPWFERHGKLEQEWQFPGIEVRRYTLSDLPAATGAAPQPNAPSAPSGGK
jgi:4-amino-4-deoxy-L-arabinose transferase-like glycosyltransferase